MGMNIGDVYATLNIDGSKVKASALKVATVAGVAVAGALTAVLTNRMLDVEKATASFRKETGATAEEAERAGKAINEMAGRNLQPIEEIGEALTKVHTDLGLTGDEAEEVTESFLRFGRATDQDAAAAVLAFDDILDAWNLTAADAQGLMDKLIVSHQEYGGSIEDNQATLAKLAPALQAANMEVDDGIALLNLFDASGVDATAAVTGMTKALTAVESPEELQALIDDISATEDPFLRAEKATALFGARAGAKLGQALAGANLDDYAVSLDEAAGATDRAADASLTMVDRIRLAFNGFVSGAVETLGPAGPLLTAVGSLGLLLAPALGAAFRAVTPLIRGSVAAAGAAAGRIYAGAQALTGGGFLPAFGGGIKAGIPRLLGMLGPIAVAVTVAWVLKEPLNDFIDRTFGEVGREVSDFADAAAFAKEAAARGYIVLGNALVLDPATGKEISEEIKQSIRDHLWGPTVEGIGEDMGGEVAAVGQALRDTVVSFMSSIGSAIREGTAGAGRNLVRFARQFEEVPETLASSIRGGRQTVRDAMADLMFMLTHPMARAKLVAKIEGELTGKALARALRSKNPDVRAAGEATRAILIAEWEKLTGKTWDYGKSTSENLGRGIKNKKGAATGAARDVATGVGQEIGGNAAAEAAFTAGARVTTRYASGIRSAIGQIGSAVGAIANAIADGLRPGSPTKTGPLSKGGGIESWARDLSGQFARGWRPFDITDALGLAAPGALTVTGGLTATGPTVIEHRHTLTAEGARNLHAAGYPISEVEQIFRDAEAHASLRYVGGRP